MRSLSPLTGEALAKAIDRLRHPEPGGKIEEALQFGIDLTLLIEQIQLSPAARAQRMHHLAQAAASVRGVASRS